MRKTAPLIVCAIAVAAMSACQTGVMGFEYVGPDVQVNIDSAQTDRATPVKVALGPGRYLVQPVGTAEGGAYDAWKAWCWAERRNADGSWTFGWQNAYWVASDQFPAFRVSDGLVYGNATDALANAQPATISLIAAGVVSFYIEDSPRFDNFGGMTLRIRKVP